MNTSNPSPEPGTFGTRLRRIVSFLRVRVLTFLHLCGITCAALGARIVARSHRLWEGFVNAVLRLLERSYKMVYKHATRKIGDTVRLKGLDGDWRLFAELKGDYRWSAVPAQDQRLAPLEVQTLGGYRVNVSNGVVWSVDFAQSQIVREP